MKNQYMISKAIFAITFFVLFAVAGDGVANEDPFELKSGVVEYKMTGDRKGVETLYFDDYGKKMMWLREVTSTYGSRSRKIKLMYLKAGSYNYMIDLIKMTAIKSVETTFDEGELKKTIKDSIPEATDSIADDFASNVFAEKEVLGTEKVLGRICEVTKPAFRKQCAYKGIPLLEYSYPNDTLIKEAIRFEENVVVPEEKFTLPEGLTIQEGPSRKDMIKGLFSNPGK